MTNKRIQLALVALMTVLVLGSVSLAVMLDNRVVKARDVSLTDMTNGSATGMLDIQSAPRDGVDNVRIDVDVRGLPMHANEVYEGWLVDSESGYMLSLGTLMTNQQGRGRFDFNQKQPNFLVYDHFVITREPQYDTDPTAGDVVLSAMIPLPEQMVRFTTQLRGSYQVPATNSSARGNGRFVLDANENTLSYDIRFNGLRTNETMAHIHGPALMNETAGVVFELPLGTHISGVWHYNESQESDILAGMMYVNVHSDAFPNGEIRGQILPE